MSTTKHTPGPWRRDEVHDTIIQTDIDGTTIEIAEVFAEEDGDVAENGELAGQALADARLIAAAPELLEALQKMNRAYVNLLETGRDRIVMLGGECDPVDVMESRDPHLRESRAAIAKATGGAS